MKKTLIAGLLGATLLGGAAIAQDAAQDRPMRPDPLLRLDANQDGIVTKDEMLADVAARFAKLDTNKDDKISTEEREARMERHGPRRGHAMMQRLDADGDGAVSLAEQQAQATRRFDRIDANHDGRIDQAERDALRTKKMAKRGPGRHHGMNRGGDMPPPPPPADAPESE